MNESSSTSKETGENLTESYLKPCIQLLYTSITCLPRGGDSPETNLDHWSRSICKPPDIDLCLIMYVAITLVVILLLPNSLALT